MSTLKLTNNNGEKPTVKLIGEDGNIFSIMARVKTAMDKFGREYPEYEETKIFEQYQDAVFNGTYDEALQETMKYCNAE